MVCWCGELECAGSSRWSISQVTLGDEFRATLSRGEGRESIIIDGPRPAQSGQGKKRTAPSQSFSCIDYNDYTAI